MRNLKLVVSTLGLLGSLAGSASAVTLWNSSSYSRISYTSTNGLSISGAQGSPISLTVVGLSFSSATNHAGASPIHASLDSATNGSINNVIHNSTATSIAGAWNLSISNNTAQNRDFSFNWLWHVDAMTSVNPGETAFSYANAGLFGSTFGFNQVSAFGNTSNTLTGITHMTITVPAFSSAFLFVNASSGGSAHPLPEPSSVALLIGAGISGSVLLKRRRK